MKRNESKLLGMCCVAFLAMGASQQLACGQPTPKQTDYVSCLLRITCDPQSYLSEFSTIQTLLYNADLIALLEEQVPGIADGSTARERWRFTVKLISKNQQADVLLARLNVNTSHYSDRTLSTSTEIVDVVVDQLRTNLIKLDQELDRRNLKRLARLQDRLTIESRNIARKRSEISVASFNALGQPSLSPESQEALFLRLHSKRQEAELEVRALGARIKQLQIKIAESASLSKEVDQDPVIQALIQVVASLENAVELVEDTDRPAASEESNPHDIRQENSNLRTRLFQAQAELAMRRDEVIQRLAGDQLLEMERKLTATEIEHAEAMVKLEFIRDQIKQFDLSGSRSSEIERLRRTVEAKEEVQKQLLRRSEELMTQISLHEPPTVTIISLDQNSPADKVEDESKKSDSSD